MNRTIEKSLLWYDFAEYSKLNINELRLLLSYIAKINPRKDNTSTVSIKLSWICNSVFCLTSESKRNILKAVDYWNTTSWIDKNDMHIKVFEYVNYSIDDMGNEVINMKCSEDFKRYFFHIRKNGYVEYSIDNVYNLLSVNQVTVYEILKNTLKVITKKATKEKDLKSSYNYGDYSINPYSIKIETFVKEYLKLNDTYLDYNYFNKNFFKKTIERINKCTDLSIDYAPDKRYSKFNKKVTHIKFDISEQELNKRSIKRKSLYKHEPPQKATDTTNNYYYDDDYISYLPSDTPPPTPYKDKYSYLEAYGDEPEDSKRHKKIDLLINCIQELNSKSYRFVFRGQKIFFLIPRILKETLTRNNLPPEFSSIKYFSDDDIDYWISAFQMLKKSKSYIKGNNFFIDNFKFKGNGLYKNYVEKEERKPYYEIIAKAEKIDKAEAIDILRKYEIKNIHDLEIISLDRLKEIADDIETDFLIFGKW